MVKFSGEKRERKKTYLAHLRVRKPIRKPPSATTSKKKKDRAGSTSCLESEQAENLAHLRTRRSKRRLAKKEKHRAAAGISFLHALARLDEFKANLPRQLAGDAALVEEVLYEDFATELGFRNPSSLYPVITSDSRTTEIINYFASHFLFQITDAAPAPWDPPPPPCLLVEIPTWALAAFFLTCSEPLDHQSHEDAAQPLPHPTSSVPISPSQIVKNDYEQPFSPTLRLSALFETPIVPTPISPCEVRYVPPSRQAFSANASDQSAPPPRILSAPLPVKRRLFVEPEESVPFSPSQVIVSPPDTPPEDSNPDEWNTTPELSAKESNPDAMNIPPESPIESIPDATNTPSNSPTEESNPDATNDDDEGDSRS